MDLLGKLGIDWRLLIAQIINFVVLMTALSFLLYKPILKVLEKRRRTIAESLENAERIKNDLNRTALETSKMINEATGEAHRIVTEARREAETLRAAALVKAQEDAAFIVSEGKAQLTAEREAILHEVRAASADLIIAATSKVIGEKLSTKSDYELIGRAIKEK